MGKSKTWIKTAVVIVILGVVVLFDYQSHKLALPAEYWYWAVAILVVGLIAKVYTDKIIIKWFPGSKKAETITEILFIAVIVVLQLMLFAQTYRMPG